MTITKAPSLSPTDLEFRVASALGRISRLEATVNSHSIKLGDKAQGSESDETEYDMELKYSLTEVLEPEESEFTVQEVHTPENDTATFMKMDIRNWLKHNLSDEDLSNEDLSNEGLSNEVLAARFNTCCRRIMSSQFLLGCLYFVLCTLLCMVLFTIARFGYLVYMGQLNVAVWDPVAQETWTVIGGAVKRRNAVPRFNIKLAWMK